MKVVYSQGEITLEDIVKYHFLNGSAQSVCAEVIRNKEVMKKAQQLGIRVSDDELQQYADAFRSVRGLHSADETLIFLQNADATEDDFAAFCETVLVTSKLIEHLANDTQVNEHFLNNRSDFDLARISIISVKDKNLADEIAMQVNEDGEDFHILARRHSVDKATKHSGGNAGWISRNMLPPDVASKVFTAGSGDLLGPFQNQDLFQLILVEEVTRGELTDSVKDTIKERLYLEWASQFLRDGIKLSK
jgi:parvulin-like peptidyl-prolyl isomerase